MNDFGNDVHAVVMFHASAQLWRQHEVLEQLPALYGGALTCPLASSDLASLPSDFSPATLDFSTFQLGEHPILEIMFSVGDLKLRWLADAKDLEVWEDLHYWREWKILPVVIGVEQGGTWAYRFYSPEVPDLPPMPDDLVNYRHAWDESEPWASMVEYVKDHPDAYPVMSNRVPARPTPDNTTTLKVVLSAGGC